MGKGCPPLETPFACSAAAGALYAKHWQFTHYHSECIFRRWRTSALTSSRCWPGGRAGRPPTPAAARTAATPASSGRGTAEEGAKKNSLVCISTKFVAFKRWWCQRHVRATFKFFFFPSYPLYTSPLTRKFQFTHMLALLGIIINLLGLLGI